MLLALITRAAGKQKAEAPGRAELEPGRWVERHGDAMYRYAVARLKDRGAAESAVQEAFLAGLEGLDRFAGRSSERTWLMGILKHKIVDRFRHGARQVEVEDLEALTDQAEQEAFDERGRWRAAPLTWRAPDASLEAAQLWEVLERCLENLPPRLARAFSLREIEGLSTAEICKIMGITATNLGVMLHRARTQLRHCLELGWFASAEEP